MSSGTLTAPELKPLLERLIEHMGGARVIGVHHAGTWAGNERIVVRGETLPVRHCSSLLDVHDALASLQDDERLVLITPFEARALGTDVLSRFVRQELVRPRPLLAVRSLFGDARDVDRRVAKADWMLEELLELAPSEGYAPTEAGTLTYDRAWSELMRRGFGLPASPTLLELVRWGASPSGEALRAARAELRVALAEQVTAVVGAGEVLAALEHGPPGATVVGGIVAGLLDPDERAAGQFEANVLGGARLGNGEAWARAAEGVLSEASHAEGDAWAAQAQELATRLDLVDRFDRSDVLPAAFEARLTALGHALDDDRSRLGDAVGAVGRHRLARRHARLPLALEMVERLARRPTGQPVELLSEAVAKEVGDGGWTAWARAAAADAAIGPATAGVGRLLEEIDERRRAESLAFAQLACAWDGDRQADVLGVEHVLDAIVAPIVAASPTLVVVIDGLSQGVARELLTELVAAGWQERRPEELDRRPAALAALPSLTGYSRSALLCGRLGAGSGQDVERRGFVGHELLRQRAGHAPLLLHQRELTAETEGLPVDVGEAVASGPRLVGVVVNAVDDALSGGAQQRTRWTADEVPVLRALLDAAAAAERTVVIVSDHGHVPERAGMRRIGPGGSSSAGARRRSIDGAPAREGEIVADGPRVVGADRVILAVDPRVRYVAKAAAGYHGGASPEELVAPVIVLTATSSPLAGLIDQPADEPTWWRPATAEAPATEPRRTTRPSSGQLAFDGVRSSVTLDRAGGIAWIDALFAAPLLAEQRSRYARTGIDDDRLRAVLTTLATSGRLTRAGLIQRAGLPSARIDGLLSVVRAILNVEGVPVLDVDGAADAVTLNVALLREQFGV